MQSYSISQLTKCQSLLIRPSHFRQIEHVINWPTFSGAKCRISLFYDNSEANGHVTSIFELCVHDHQQKNVTSNISSRLRMFLIFTLRSNFRILLFLLYSICPLELLVTKYFGFHVLLYHDVGNEINLTMKSETGFFYLQNF